MLQLTDTQIATWVASFILPLFRIAAVLMTMPSESPTKIVFTPDSSMIFAVV
jgi:flagellar biosynthesis protein FliR